MTIQQRLQLVIQFILGNPTSDAEDLINYLVSQGDVLEEAQAAMPLYLGMMVSFGYLVNPTYEDMRDWGNTHSLEVIGVATSVMLEAYNQQKEKQIKAATLQAEIEQLQSRLTELQSINLDNNYLLAFAESSHPLKQSVQVLTIQLQKIQNELTEAQDWYNDIPEDQLLSWAKENNELFLEQVYIEAQISALTFEIGNL